METTQKPGANTHVVMAVLAYLGIFIIVSYFVAKDDPFVKFHIKQGLILFIIEILSGFLATSVWMLWPFLPVINLGVLVLAIIGIIHVARGEEKELPLVGSLARNFSF